MAKKIEEMIGLKSDKLTIVDFVKSENGQRYWKCQCECGNYIVKTTNAIFAKNKRHSCGCIRKNHPNNTKHGMSHTRINSTYRKMKQRCFSETDSRYKDYGGRGITICNEWLGKDGFINFYNWAINNGYDDSLTIDRINVNGNYCPENCRWSTWKEQARNQRKSIIISFEGKTLPLKEWAEIKNVPYERLRKRIVNLGWSVERALTT